MLIFVFFCNYVYIIGLKRMANLTLFHPQNGKVEEKEVHREGQFVNLLQVSSVPITWRKN
ncbi:MAG: hypothetical protein Ta2B_15490 [Termitinemataceae bacterium]|nr:MAG: hypothetical protein Ta2B_15490 [Termitinemataceae bacterium]